MLDNLTGGQKTTLIAVGISALVIVVVVLIVMLTLPSSSNDGGSVSKDAPEPTPEKPHARIHSTAIRNYEKLPETIDADMVRMVDSETNTILERVPPKETHQLTEVKVDSVGVESNTDIERPVTMVFRRRDPTGWYAAVSAFVMPFHWLALRKKDGSGLVYGCDGPVPLTEEPPYVYNSNMPELIVADVKKSKESYLTGADMSCAARYLEFQMDIEDRLHVLRINISHCGRVGDILTWQPKNENDKRVEDEEFYWYSSDKGFISVRETRPDDAATIVPRGRYDELNDVDYVLPIPIEVLYDRVPEGADSVDIEIIPATVVCFTRRPPVNVTREWVVRHVSFHDLDQCLVAILS